MGGYADVVNYSIRYPSALLDRCNNGINLSPHSSCICTPEPSEEEPLYLYYQCHCVTTLQEVCMTVHRWLF